MEGRAVLRQDELDADGALALTALLSRYGLSVAPVAPGQPIPGSHWGEPEAGIIGVELHVRPDTPLHSVLHEACHYVCMAPQRREALHTDAGGGYDEENGACYLSILLAGLIPGMGFARMLADMDAWGYTFRLGSAAAWFGQDAQDALQWLRRQDLVDAQSQPTWKLRATSGEHAK